MHRLNLFPMARRTFGWTPFSIATMPLKPFKQRHCVQRLLDIKFDFSCIPDLFCDGIDLDAMEKPFSVDVYGHFIDRKNLEKYKKLTYYESQEGKYINPFSRAHSILSPFTFKPKTQRQLEKVLVAIEHLEQPLTEGNDELVLEIMDIKDKLEGYQLELINTLLKLVFGIESGPFPTREEHKKTELDKVRESHNLEKLLSLVKEEASDIQSNLARYAHEEKIRKEKEVELNNLFNAYVSNLERIHALCTKLALIDAWIDNPTDEDAFHAALGKASIKFNITYSLYTEKLIYLLCENPLKLDKNCDYLNLNETEHLFLKHGAVKNHKKILIQSLIEELEQFFLFMQSIVPPDEVEKLLSKERALHAELKHALTLKNNKALEIDGRDQCKEIDLRDIDSATNHLVGPSVNALTTDSSTPSTSQRAQQEEEDGAEKEAEANISVRLRHS